MNLARLFSMNPLRAFFFSMNSYEKNTYFQEIITMNPLRFSMNQYAPDEPLDELSMNFRWTKRTFDELSMNQHVSMNHSMNPLRSRWTRNVLDEPLDEPTAPSMNHFASMNPMTRWTFDEPTAFSMNFNETRWTFRWTSMNLPMNSDELGVQWTSMNFRWTFDELFDELSMNFSMNPSMNPLRFGWTSVNTRSDSDTLK